MQLSADDGVTWSDAVGAPVTSDVTPDAVAGAGFVLYDPEVPPTLLAVRTTSRDTATAALSASAGGDVLELHGANFAPNGVLGCRVGDAVVQASFVSPVLARCETPPRLAATGDAASGAAIW